MHESQLIEHRLLDEHAFLLVDSAHGMSDFWRNLPGESLAPAELIAEADALPRLVIIDQLNPTQRQRLFDEILAAPAEFPRPFAALLAADITASHLATHLRRRLIVAISSQGKHLFRYYDPRVFRHLLWMATPIQLAALYGRISAWTWCDARGRWRRSLRPENTGLVSSFRMAGLDLSRIGLLERCLKTLRNTLTEFIDDVENVQARRVNSLLDAALSKGLVDEADLSLYVTQAIRFHPDIHSHPELASRLRSLDEDSYVGACSNIDENTLTRYAREIVSQRKEHA